MRLLSIRRHKKKAQGLDASLAVSVIGGKGFTNAEITTIESPYIVVRSNHYRFSSPRLPVEPPDNHVEWDTEFLIPLDTWKGPPLLSFTAWDKSDDNRKAYLGEVAVFFTDLVMNKPYWLSLNRQEDGRVVMSGQIQVKFSVVSASIEPAFVPQGWTNFLESFKTKKSKSSFLARKLSRKGGKKAGKRIGGQIYKGDPAVSDSHDSSKTSLGLTGLVSDLDPDFNDLSLSDSDLESDTDVTGGREDSPDSAQGPPGLPASTSSSTIDHHSPKESKSNVARGPLSSSSRALLSGPSKRTHRKSHLSFKRRKSLQQFKLNVYNNTLGVMFLELEKIVNLPKDQRNMTRTSFDMDPFVIISFGKKTFRSPYKRHTLNPIYNEKLMFPVQAHEQGFSVKFTVMDKDRLSLNDYIADGTIEMSRLMANVPEPDEVGLYRAEELKSGCLKRHELELGRRSSKPWKNNIPPIMTVSAQFMPYAALRQMLWRQLATMYDTDETNTINSLELDALLDSIGSTLTRKSRDGFFRRFNKNPEMDELTIDQLVLCLEAQVAEDTEAYRRQIAEKLIKQGERIGLSRDEPSTSHSAVSSSPEIDINMADGSSDIEDYENNSLYDEDEDEDEEEEQEEEEDVESVDDERQGSANTLDIPTSSSQSRTQANSSADARSLSGFSAPSSISDSEYLEPESKQGQTAERVIELSSCPFCGQPRLRKRSEVDLVTHMAVCANQNWSRVDALVLDRYVSSSQAGKRWYTKAIKKVWYGNYKLGANSANILVQNRVTGEILEEKMSVYVRIGIRLLYKGLKSSRMEKKRIKSLLRSLSVKQGRKYDDASSVQAIEPFIKFHRLNMSEVEGSIDSFRNFNEFFYRKLKQGARPCDHQNEPRVLVSPADSRATFFPTVSEAQRLWIKGTAFSIERLFGDAYPDMVTRFINGPLAIFRLAPQDYHRFHCPVDGRMLEPKLIEGEYYTVNPMAIRSALDVYGENVRVLVPIETECFGTVMVLCVGAMMVGSTIITAEQGPIKRTDELGYFKFGGSTLVVLFEPGAVEFDEDLVRNSQQTLETLVRVGMNVGHDPELDLTKL